MMKTAKRNLTAVLLAAAMIVTGMFPWGAVTVQAAGEGEQEDLVLLKGISPADESDLSNMAAGDSFSVKIEAEAPEGVGINSVVLFYRDNKTYTNKTYINSFQSDDRWYPAEESSVVVDVDINKYDAAGTYSLIGITFVVGTVGYNYSYNYQNGYMELKITGDPEVKDTFSYDECVDYTIQSESVTDSYIPEITGISLIPGGDIVSGTEFGIDLDYKEEGSGIREISITYKGEDQSILLFAKDDFAAGEYTGTGTIHIRTACVQDPGTYVLDTVSVTDHAGNQRYYQREPDSDWMVSNRSSETDCRFKASDDIRLTYGDSNAPKIKGMRIAENLDKDNLTAGTDIDVFLKIYNDTQTKIQINPQDYVIRWKADNGKKISVQGTGETFTLEETDEKEVHFIVKTDATTEGLQWKLQSIEWGDPETTGVYTERDSDCLSLTSYNAAGEIVDWIAYGEELEFSFAGEAAVLKGDVNGDGEIDLTDFLMVLDHVSGSKVLEEQQYVASDINNDGSVDLDDMLRLLDYVSGTKTEL